MLIIGNRRKIRPLQPLSNGKSETSMRLQCPEEIKGSALFSAWVRIGAHGALHKVSRVAAQVRMSLEVGPIGLLAGCTTQAVDLRHCSDY